MDLAQYLWVVWLVVALVCVIIELVTLEFTFLMIAIASMIGLVTSLTGLPLLVQIIVAAVAAIALLFLVRPPLLERLQRGSSTAKQGIDALIGMRGEVVMTFQRGAGQVSLTNGETWTSRISPTVRPRDLDVGERVVVTAIDGATAVVVPAERG